MLGLTFLFLFTVAATIGCLVWGVAPKNKALALTGTTYLFVFLLEWISFRWGR